MEYILQIRTILQFMFSFWVAEMTLANCRDKIVNLADIRQNYKDLYYTLDGPIYFRCQEIEEELKQGVSFPFKTVMKFHKGDAKATGLMPMTYVRQVIAAAAYPELDYSVEGIPTDVFETAQMINEDSAGGVGSYSDPEGLDLIRRNVAKFIKLRDGGIESRFEDIVLTDGVTDGLSTIVKLLQNECKEMKVGIMIPQPTYPYYVTMLQKYDFHQISYFLTEGRDWDLEIRELERSYDDALQNCNCKPRAILIVNPGNPSAKLLSRERIQSIIKFAYKKHLVILVDEVFQDQVYRTDLKFESFKKIAMKLGAPYSEMELVSFHSISKGFVAEHGFRGGYFEFINLDPAVKDVLFQLLSQKQCSNRLGQVGLNCLVDPPTSSEPSYELYENEKFEIIDGYRNISKKMRKELNKLQGVRCSSIDAGITAFPNLNLPLKALAAANKSGMPVDLFYGLELLESTGIAVAVGTAFGLSPNLTYLRITLPSSMAQLDEFIKLFADFHKRFMMMYS